MSASPPGGLEVEEPMDAIAGMTTTARRVQGPGFELLGLTGARGAHTALWFPKGPLRDEAVVVPSGPRAFLERPGLPGLARLAAVDADAGALVYATGRTWSLAEAAASLRRTGRVPGLRAGLELCWRGAELLAEAHAEGAALGAPVHGAVDPWRLALRPDGQVLLLGYGVAPGRLGLRAEGAAGVEALRYAPPERLAGRAEDPTSDLFSLVLVAVEWMLGEPVYVGEADAVRRQAEEASGDRRLYAWRDRLPDDLVTVLGRALRRERDARWPDATALAAAARRALASPSVTGPGLHHLAETLEPTERFMGLGEERGEVDRPVAEAAASDAPRPRYVALGGRRGGVRATSAPAAPPPVAVDDVPDTFDLPADEPMEVPTSAVEPLDGPPTAVEAFPAEEEVPMTSVDPIPLPGEEDEDGPMTSVEPIPLLGEEDEGFGDDGPTTVDPIPRAELPMDEEPPTHVAPLPGGFGEDAPTQRVSADDVSALLDGLEAPLPDDLGGLSPIDPVDTPDAPAGPTPSPSAPSRWVVLRVRAPDGAVVEHEAPPDRPLGAVADGLARQLGLPTTDLAGRTVCAWSIAVDGRAVVPDNRAEDVARRELGLVRVDNRFATARVVVRHGGDRHFEAPVGSAVTARAMVAFLVDRLDLPAGPWTLLADGAALEGWETLGERARDGVVLELRT